MSQGKYIRTEETIRKLSETRRKRIMEGKFSVWNKGLTKEDLRVYRNISGGSRKTQFKSEPKLEFKRNGNPNWKGGKTTSGAGYILVLNTEHPNNVSGYVLEHRLVMENKIGRLLNKDEIVHHINGITEDNRIENLLILTQGEHTRLHHTKHNIEQKN